MKPQLYVLIGIPGSGKSTFAKNVLTEISTVISRDEIRYSIIKDEEAYFSHEKEVYKKFIKQIKDLMVQGKDVTVDATHLNATSRFKLLSNLKGFDYKINAFYFDTPLDECLGRNAMRRGRAHVPEDAIENMYDNLTFPSKKEGFDYIYTVRNGKIVKEEL